MAIEFDLKLKSNTIKAGGGGATEKIWFFQFTDAVKLWWFDGTDDGYINDVSVRDSHILDAVYQ